MADRAGLYDTLRRRVAPLALILALGFLAVRTCQAESAAVDLRLRFGSAAQTVRALDVDIYPEGETERAAFLRYSWGGGGAPAAVTREVQLGEGLYRLDISADTAGGIEHLERVIDVRGSGQQVTVDLEAALTPAEP